ncbi:hypothetical protein PAP_01550 [Palaeococcus pacificus DY20341]|uniref:KaiC-like domain-containing protein n=1 Tax=Palaeococcus pacificus DY20341 TaxID=1343739 RepID=A0A075LPY3_9EURY|nr:DUF257 family protein [Palaeococcus pacificus]AIF68750.1 hypothetical protein PAP_01550 [Palaeococcus pacificus DY20341]
MQFHKLIESLKPGETVLIEYDSKTFPIYELYSAVKYAREKGFKILIDDYLDTLYIYNVHLELSKLDTSIFDNVSVIKIGGHRGVGNVLESISLRSGPIIKKEYEKAYKKAIKENEGIFLNPVLGLEKFLLLSESKLDILEEIGDISLYVGDKRRIAIYFINKHVLEGLEFNPLPILEAIATTVINIKKKGRIHQFNVIKSINPEIDDKAFDYDLDSLEE